MRGRKPTPTQLKIVRANPGKRPLNAHEPKPVCANPEEVPEWLSAEAREHWPTIAKQLADAGVLSVLDRAALAQYCEAFAIWRQAYEKVLKFGLIVKAQSGFPVQSPFLSIANVQSERMLRILAEFGMTPASRSRVTVSKADDERWSRKFGQTGKWNARGLSQR
ncbi:phage terminase small subunit P27 family [Burkholderia pseudomallei]|uniref:phage terminase small subunit P27 family n=2 Tax=Burkholderia pseudomallei TaxID=28450 RepID=UPI000811CDB6|nr:phage terminase small subunit P27 family [Burkholderia pseudomallei]ANW50101.1 terminase [Burkholderia pseudomallei]ANW56111.1 terminase [Burkholderia pseudomallei]